MRPTNSTPTTLPFEALVARPGAAFPGPCAQIAIAAIRSSEVTEATLRNPKNRDDQADIGLFTETPYSSTLPINGGNPL